MNILIDTSVLKNGNSVRGIGRYTKELVQALEASQTTHHFFTSETRGNSPIDLIHYPFFDFFFPTLPLFKSAKTVVTIHDVIPLLFPNQYRPGLRGSLAHLYQRVSLSSVAGVITDSESSKRDIIDHLKLPSDKIKVVYLAASPQIQRPLQQSLDEVRKKYELPKYFVLYVGDINYNKNLPFLISVMRNFPKLTLVLAGKNVTNTRIDEGKAIVNAIAQNALEKRVRLIDSVQTSEELAALYSLATVYVQPSLYEGFGLPVLEAMQCKTPVACSKAGSLPEVAGEAAIYFHPLSVEECSQAIEKVLKFSEKQRAAQIKKGVEQASTFTWKRTAGETIAAYEAMVI